MAQYFVDNASGLDTNTGTSSFSPWKHCPGDALATNNALACIPQAGDFIYFRKGVTYTGGLITCGQSGSVVVNHATSNMDAMVTAAGVLTSTSGGFVAAGVQVGDRVYLFHNKASQDDTWVDTVGLFTVGSVDSATQITLSDFDREAWATAEIPYLIIRPITYTVQDGWGSGDAVISGAGTLTSVIFPNGESCLRFEGLKFYQTADTGTREDAAIKNSTAPYFQLIGCSFDHCYNAGVYLTSDYSVVSGNTCTNFHGYGLRVAGKYNLQEYNTIIGIAGGTYSVRSGLNGSYYTIIQGNIVKDITGGGTTGVPWYGAHADSIGYVDGGDGGNDYGHVRGNVVDSFIEGMAFYGTSTESSPMGTDGWQIYNNLVISRKSTTGKGDCAILLMGTTHMRIWGNTFVGLSGGGGFGDFAGNAIRLEDHSSVGDCAYVDIRNNTFAWNSATSAINVQVDQTVGFVCDNNQYYREGAAMGFWFEGVAKTLTSWKALGLDTNGMEGNPIFLSVSTEDFHLMATSPGRDAGQDLSVAFDTDLDEEPRVAWSIGAYEYAGSAPVPTSGTLALKSASGTLAVGMVV